MHAWLMCVGLYNQYLMHASGKNINCALRGLNHCQPVWAELWVANYRSVLTVILNNTHSISESFV